MERNGVSGVPDRRQLLLQMLPAGAFACLLCRRGLAAAAQDKGPAPPAKHKFQEPCEMSYDELFQFAYARGFIPYMTALAEDVGREKLVEMLKKASCAATEREVREGLRTDPKNDLTTFTEDLRNPNPLFKHVLTFQLVEDRPTAVEVRVTECLWAKTFCGANAADIGYASICYPDFAAAPAFNPKMHMIRTKTLMQGNDCCNHRWVMEA
jgi:L-2-amino-thiazoline-4-carboxylic acid hydrolase